MTTDLAAPDCTLDPACCLSDGHAGACAMEPVPTLPAVTLTRGLPFADPVALKQQLDRYTVTRKVFLEWISSELRAGTDYMVIHRKVRGQDCPNKADATANRCAACKGKATLCKPGSEKIAGLLQLTPKFRRDTESLDMVRNVEGLVAFVCELVNADGQVVAEGRGARAVAQDFGDVNKSLKMCEKSAQIDATLRLAGLSEVFTQDLEDGGIREDEEKPPFTPPRRASDNQKATDRTSDRNAPAREPGSDDAPPADAITPGKVSRVYALIHEALKPHDADDKAHMEAMEDELTFRTKQRTGRDSWKQIPWKDYEKMCEAIPKIADEIVARVAKKPHARRVRR